MLLGSLPPSASDVFGGRVTFNPTADGQWLAVYASPYGWSVQALLTEDEVNAVWFDAEVADRAAVPPPLTDELGNPIPPQCPDQPWCPPPPNPDLSVPVPVPPPSPPWIIACAFTEPVMVPKGPEWLCRGLSERAALDAGMWLQSPGYAQYVASHGGIVDYGGLWYYANDLNAAVAARKAHKPDFITSALRVVVPAVIGWIAGGVVGSLVSSSASSVSSSGTSSVDYTSVTDPAQTTANADIINSFTSSVDSSGLLTSDVTASIDDIYSQFLNNSNAILDNTTAVVSDGRGGLLSGAGSILKSVTNAIIGGVTGPAGSGGNALVSILQTLAAGLHDVIGAVQSTLAPILTPIRDAVSVTASAMRDLNDNLIKPIFGTIASLQRTFTALSDAIHRDLSGGIQGFVRLSQDLATGLTSAESAMTRGLQQLGSQNAENIKGPLSDALKGNVGVHLEAIAGALAGGQGAPGVSAEGAPNLHFGEDFDAARFAGALADLTTAARSYHGILEPFLHILVVLLDVGPIAVGYLKASTEKAFEAGRAAFQGSHLAVGDAITAAQRRIIDADSLDIELSAAGFTPARRQALVDLATRAVPLTEAVEAWRRGLIDQATRDDLLKRQGVLPEDLERTVQISEVLRPLTTIIQELSFMDAGPRTGFLDPGNMSAPDTVIAMAAETGAATATVEAAWRLQWALPNVGQATQMYFRNLITLDQLWALYDLANIPERLRFTLLESQRTTIPARTAISMHAAGIITAQRMHDIVMAEGYTLEDAEAFIRYSERAGGGPAPQAVDQLHGLTQSVVLNLYQAGSIDRAQTVVLLEQIGFGTQAAELAVQLVDLQQQTDERAAEADWIVEQVAAGMLTIDEAQAALLAAGLTTTEMEKTYAKLLKQQRSKTKLPSLSDLAGMWKAGVLIDAEYLNGVQLLGYSMYWAGRYLEQLKAV